MINNCPHCRVALKFSEAQLAKLNKAMQNLGPGKKLTIKCPQCRQGIHLQVEGKREAAAAGTVAPPAPPDLDWLKTGRFEEEEKVEDVPMALVLHSEPAAREKVKAAMESVGYRVVTAEKVDEAIEQMRFISFACIAFHTDFEPGGLAASVFHDYMRKMSMERRRYIFYILIGPQLHSLYDLEALAHSANLVVAEHDLAHFDLILRKAIPDYEELFGAILEELGAYGKR
jgi:CheY-like chemotaxis protein